VLQAKKTDVIGRFRDRLTHICHESPLMLVGCVGRKVKRQMSLANIWEFAPKDIMGYNRISRICKDIMRESEYDFRVYPQKDVLSR
jgi:hypothetical protein